MAVSIHTQNLSRRHLVVGTAGVATLAASGTSVASDPAFVAIRRHRETFHALERACMAADTVQAKMEGRKVTALDEENYEQASEKEIEACEALMQVVPETRAGLRTLLEYVRDFVVTGHDIDAVTLFVALAKSPALKF